MPSRQAEFVYARSSAVPGAMNDPDANGLAAGAVAVGGCRGFRGDQRSVDPHASPFFAWQVVPAIPSRPSL